jgi:hypothetical protein
MRTLHVAIGRSIEGYPTRKAAIAAAKSHPHQQKTRADSALLVDRFFVGGHCSHSHWCLEFTGSLWLNITCWNDEVRWEVTHEPPAFASSVEQFRLRWPSGEEILIDPETLLADRVGAEFWQLWVNELGLLVYLRGKRILWFDTVRHVEDGTCILLVSEDD